LKQLFFLPILLIAFLTKAQNSNISGQVLDAQSNEAIEYAGVSIYNASDSSIVTGTVTTESGQFILDKVSSGSYFIRTQFLGYETKQSDVFSLNSGQRLQMGTIALVPSTQLMNEVTISGKKINAMIELDKQIYNAEQFESARGGTAVDVLRNMPSVAINGLGEITVRGTSGFLVMINGKPVITDAQTILSQLPANMVENVEVITSPSAKYDPDGKAGIINITTKKGVTDGIGLSVNAQYGLPPTTDYGNERNAKRFGFDALLNYRKNKWDISVSGNYTRNDLQGFREGDAYTNNNQENYQTRFPSTGERSFHRYNYGARALINYAASSSNLFSLGFYTGKRYQERDANLFYTNSTWTLNGEEKIADNPYYNPNKQIKQGIFTLANFDYTHNFADSSSLTFSFLYEYDDLFGTTHNFNLTEPGGEIIQYVQNPYWKPIIGYRARLDHTLPIGAGQLESGYQYRHDSQDGTFDYQVTPDQDQPDLDMFRGTAVSVNEIHSLYSQYSGASDKVEYNVGLRYEYSYRTVDLSFDEETNVLELNNLFPSANLLYTFNPKWKLKAGFSRRIQRATNNQLNPIPEREHSETLEIGDPELLPEFISIAELGVVKELEDGGSWFLTAYFQGSENPVQRVNSVYADSILNRVYTNVERGDAYGLESGADLSFFDWWDFYAGFNVYNQTYSGELIILDDPPIEINNSGWVYSFNVNTTFSLSSTLSLQATVNYLSQRVTAQGKDSRFLVPHLTLKKSFLDEKLVASLQWQNIDLGMKASNRQRISTWGEDFFTTTNYIYETDFFLINLSYNINKISNNKKLPSSEFGDKEF